MKKRVRLTSDENFYQIFADETNRYTKVSQETNGLDAKWYETNAAEMRAYIAFQIIMGIIVAPSPGMYFTKDKLFRPTAIHKRTTRDRMDKLHQYFHVTDTTENPPQRQPGHDKLAHIRPIFGKFTAKIKR